MYMRVLLLLLLWHIRPVRPAYSCLCCYSAEIPVFESISASSPALGVLRIYDCKPRYNVAGLDPDILAIQFNGTVGYVKQDGSVQAQLCAGYPIQTDLVLPAALGSTSSSFTARNITLSRAEVTSAAGIASTTSLETLPTNKSTTVSSTSRSSTTTKPPQETSTSSPAITTKPTSTSLTPTTVSTTEAPTSAPATTTAAASPTSTTAQTTVLPTSAPKLPTVSTTSATTTKATSEHITETTQHTETTQSAATSGSTTYLHNCQAGWRSHGTSCYLFKMGDQDTKQWHDAKTYCQTKGGHLVFIESQDEDQYLYSQIHLPHSAGHNVVRSLWIGATDESREDHWLWRDFKESIRMLSYQNWGHGQPNNNNGQDCATLSRLNTGWNDRDCSDLFGFICEQSPSLECDPGWTTADDTCYLFRHGRHDRLTWSQANMECVSVGGHLVFIESQDEQLYLRNYIHQNIPHTNNDEGSSIWIGAKYTTGHDDWVWMDTSSSGETPIDHFTAWNKGEPGHGDCAALARSQRYHWIDSPCSQHHPYICEKRP